MDHILLLLLLLYCRYCYLGLILGDGRFKAWVCGCSLDGIAGSTPAEGMDTLLLWVLFVAMFLRRGDHSFRGAIPSVVCLSVIVKPR